MNANHQAYGVFKPTGHVVAAFPVGTDLAGVEQALADADLRDVSCISPAQMLAQAEDDLAHASPLAGVGQELNLVKAHRERALLGDSFLVIRVPDSDAVQRTAAIANRYGASRAQHYGRMIVEELVPVGSTDRQVPESPDTGLDNQTRTGRPI